jgi:hypothetical protein
MVGSVSMSTCSDNWGHHHAAWRATFPHGTRWLSRECAIAIPRSGSQTVGMMFWFMRKRFVGSYLFLITTRRW